MTYHQNIHNKIEAQLGSEGASRAFGTTSISSLGQVQLGASLARALRAAGAFFQRRWRGYVAAKRLEALDDRLLADIGLRRTDIAGFVRNGRGAGAAALADHVAGVVYPAHPVRNTDIERDLLRRAA